MFYFAFASLALACISIIAIPYRAGYKRGRRDAVRKYCPGSFL